MQELMKRLYARWWLYVQRRIEGGGGCRLAHATPWNDMQILNLFTSPVSYTIPSSFLRDALLWHLILRTWPIPAVFEGPMPMIFLPTSENSSTSLSGSIISPSPLPWAREGGKMRKPGNEVGNFCYIGDSVNFVLQNPACLGCMI